MVALVGYLNLNHLNNVFNLINNLFISRKERNIKNYLRDPTNLEYQYPWLALLKGFDLKPILRPHLNPLIILTMHSKRK